jgi:hypothetical protein
MRHLISVGPGKAVSPIAGRFNKFNLVSTLCAISGRIRQFSRGPESVDGAELALYKTPNGGGRNPAAAVL